MLFGNRSNWQQRKEFVRATKKEIGGIYEEKKGIYWTLLKTLPKEEMLVGSVGAFLSLYVSYLWVSLFFFGGSFVLFQRKHSWEDLKTQEGKNKYLVLLCQMGICFFMMKFSLFLFFLGKELWNNL